MSKLRARLSRHAAPRAFAVLALLLCLFTSQVPLAAQSPSSAAHLRVDARRVENQISTLLYGQFIEFMFEGIKGGLHAELIRDRSFESPPNSIGLSRNWDRYPDDGNDDYGLTFHWDNKHAYPQQRKTESDANE